MIVIFKYFYEENEASENLWASSLSRILFLHDHLSHDEQLASIQQNMTPDKEILAVRFPSARFVRRNPWIHRILLGLGIPTENGSWKPKEVLFYGSIV